MNCLSLVSHVDSFYFTVLISGEGMVAASNWLLLGMMGPLTKCSPIFYAWIVGSYQAGPLKPKSQGFCGSQGQQMVPQKGFALIPGEVNYIDNPQEFFETMC